MSTRMLPPGFTEYRDSFRWGSCRGYRRLPAGADPFYYNTGAEYLFRLPRAEIYLTGSELADHLAETWRPARGDDWDWAAYRMGPELLALKAPKEAL